MQTRSVWIGDDRLPIAGCQGCEAEPEFFGPELAELPSMTSLKIPAT